MILVDTMEIINKKNAKMPAGRHIALTFIIYSLHYK